jgi:hypothetical protein
MFNGGALLLLTWCDGCLIGVRECMRENAGKGEREPTARVSPGKNWAASVGPQCCAIED